MFDFFKKKREPLELFYHTDIHSHILPGIDDGSPHVERSLELVRSMREWGLNRIIATPHVTQDKFENTPEIVTEVYGELKNALQEKDIDVELGFAAEYRIDEYFISQVEADNLMKLPEGYLLIENSYVQEPWNLANTIFQLRMKGHKLILAHPERYVYYHDKKEMYDKLHSSGVLFQVNVLSLANSYGKEVRKMAEYLIDKDYVDFLGTDLHRRTHVKQINDYLASKSYRKTRERLEGRILNDKIFAESKLS